MGEHHHLTGREVSAALRAVYGPTRLRHTRLRRWTHLLGFAVCSLVAIATTSTVLSAVGVFVLLRVPVLLVSELVLVLVPNRAAP